MADKRTCSIEGCEKPFYARDWCKMHYSRARHGAGPVFVKEHHLKGTVEERFWARVEKTDSCWIWQGASGKRGYGAFYVDKFTKQVKAHRFSYELHKGPIPEGLHIDHLCRVRNCVNPDHLQAVTNVENIMRGNGPPAINARRTHCPQGHPYSGENLRMYRGTRHCKACAKERNY